jgi:hypothetical protein
VVQGIGHLIPDQEIVGSIPAEGTAEGATARISPVWEAVRKTAEGRFDSDPRLERSVARHSGTHAVELTRACQAATRPGSADLGHHLGGEKLQVVEVAQIQDLQVHP